MMVLLLFLAAEALIIAEANAENTARNQLIQKWKKGELSMDELLYLKTRPWFRKLFPLVKLEEPLSKKKD
jgi:hypothetical protein